MHGDNSKQVTTSSEAKRAAGVEPEPQLTPQPAYSGLHCPIPIQKLKDTPHRHARRATAYTYDPDQNTTRGFTLIEVAVAIAIMVLGFLAVMLTFSQGLQWAGEVKYGHTLSNAVRSAANHCQVYYQTADALTTTAAADAQGGINYETAGYAMKIFPGKLVQLSAARGSKEIQDASEYGGWYWNLGEYQQVCLSNSYDNVNAFDYDSVVDLPSASARKLVFNEGAEWSDPENDPGIRIGDLHALRVVAYRSVAERETGNEEKAIGIYYIKAYFKHYQY